MLRTAGVDWVPVVGCKASGRLENTGWAMLRHEIKEIKESIKAGRYPTEAAVCNGIVLRLLHALSWPTFDIQIVSPQYPVEGGRVDFALCHPAGKPVAFIEVKQVGQSVGAEPQLFQYAYHRGVPMAILTDGQEWNFFLPGEQGDYGERRVYKLDLVEREIEETVHRLERYLNYSAICSGAALKTAREDYQDVARQREIEKTLPRAWSKLIEEEDEILLELLADRVESLCGYKPDPDSVAGFLRHNVFLRSSADLPGKKVAVNSAANSEIRRREHSADESTSKQIGVTLRGQLRPARNARDVLVKAFEALAQEDPMFLERFASPPKHGRTRRYLARTRDELYPGRPDLASEFSHELRHGWWLGINLSSNVIERIVKMACEVAGLRYGNDLKLNLGV